MNRYNIIYDRPENHEHMHGVALPIFIHNFSYHLCTLDVYEDGVADCWDLVPIAELHERLEDGWIDTQPPEGAKISLHDLGNAHVAEAQWILSKDEVVQQAHEILDRLNPEKKNLLDLAKRRRDIALRDNLAEDRVWQTRMHPEVSLYRLSAEGEEIPGAAVPIFCGQDGDILLTQCFIYQDRRAQIGYQGKLLPVETIEEMLEKKLLFTSVPERAWVTIPGLGRFRIAEASWYIDPHERWREILNLIAVLNGQADLIEVCHQAYLKYQAEPTEGNRAYLRTAYEAVPEHQRLYTERDMDSKDHTIRHILGL